MAPKKSSPPPAQSPTPQSTNPYRHMQTPNAPLSAWASPVANASVQAHVDSFNTFVSSTIPRLPSAVEPVELAITPTTNVKLWLCELSLSKPTRKDDCIEPRVFPADCREAHMSYTGELVAKIAVSINGATPTFLDNISLGDIPIMVNSVACHLHNLSPAALVHVAREDPDERGGYFIVNGNEKVVRLLVQMKANFPSAIIRPSYSNRGPLYTKFAVQMRCVRDDLCHTQTVTLHYRKDGSCFLRFSINKNEYLLPMLLVLKALNDPNDRCSDEELFVRLADGVNEDAFVSERVLAAMEAFRGMYGDVRTGRDAVKHLGDLFASTSQQPLSGPVGAASAPGSSASGPDGAASGSSGANLVSGSSAAAARSGPTVKGGYSAGLSLIRRHLFVHVDSFQEKQLVLILMFRKLMALVRGEIRPDNPDTTDNHDILLPGHLFGLIAKEAIEVTFEKALSVVAKKVNMPSVNGASAASGNASAALVSQEGLMTQLTQLLKSTSEVGKKLAYFLSTGNLASKTGLDLQQTTGFTIIADRLNAFRFFSHFRSVHRGAFFAEMKTTTVRKLFPETWGFLCPVHTPDGAPCGLLNHLTQGCRVTTAPVDEEGRVSVVEELVKAGMVKLGGLAVKKDTVVLQGPVGSAGTHVFVSVDGRVVGKVPLKLVPLVVGRLRKAKREGRVPEGIEIVAAGEGEKAIGLFPGVFVFTGPGRMSRPVKALEDGKVEWIGPMEQIYMSVGLNTNSEPSKPKKDVKDEGVSVSENLPITYTHKEISVPSLFSYLASLTPYSNHNQSPRNMYQCQMLKQTMGTPYLAHPHRTDNKTYKINYPQAPIVRTQTFSAGNFDVKPFGCNAVIAVIAHSGYDMEDALIINKSSYNRGFGHAVVHKQKIIDATSDGMKRKFQGLAAAGGAAAGTAGVTSGTPAASSNLMFPIEEDGLPRIGARLKEGSGIASAVPVATNGAQAKPQILEKWKEDEEGWVEQVNVISGGGFGGSLGDNAQRASVKIRVPRNPVVGDKFASRHGQKGVMALLYPQEDMPFTEISGVAPDILFNPHGFPSRMTIGMLIETMAGKAAALEGKPVVDATPFQAGAELPHEEAGRMLVKHGFRYLGTEQLYSGMHGVPIETQIFCGVVYYQRLRHMVLDKAQVRATGPIDPLTKQPVKGRKRHGGIRFGEMERDSIISHGGAFLLRDRLFECSDKHSDFVCRECGSILGVVSVERDATPVCVSCEGGGKVEKLDIPFVFRYLSAELASMNIKLRINLKDKVEGGL